MIGAIAISIAAIFVSGQYSLPYLSMITPTPAISGYIGFYAGMIALTIIPFILLVKVAIRTIWGYRPTVKFKQSITSVWIVSFMIFVLTGVFTARHFSPETSRSEVVLASGINTEEPFKVEVNRPLSDRDFRGI